MERQEGKQDRVIKVASYVNDPFVTVDYYLKESGKITSQSILREKDANGHIFPEQEVTEKHLHNVNIDWENKTVTNAQRSEEPAKPERKSRTIFNSVAELGRKIAQPIRKGGK
jgi:hypothetical protein